jgi:hypothetical protein
MQYLRYLKQFFKIMFKIENAKELPTNVNEKMDESDEEKEDEEIRTGCPKILITAVGIGYHNLTKTII